MAETVREGILSASHDYDAAADADMVLVAVQTDKKGFGPDYGPLFEALEGLAAGAAQASPRATSRSSSSSRRWRRPA